VCQESCDLFSRLIGSKSKEIIYCGDHIYGDVLMCKKKHGWRTFLCVPELVQELYVLTRKKKLFTRRQHLEAIIEDALSNPDSASGIHPNVGKLEDAMRVRDCLWAVSITECVNTSECNGVIGTHGIKLLYILITEWVCNG
jgi:hypothetical protein